MERLAQKRERLQRRIRRIRSSVRLGAGRPRLCFSQSNYYLLAQIVDDSRGHTLCSASTGEKDFKNRGKNKTAAYELGELLASRALERKIAKVSLDRRGKLYHGRVAEFSKGARNKGLEF